jgi:hypothetical protein
VDPSTNVKNVRYLSKCEFDVCMYVCMYISTNILYLCTCRKEHRTSPQRCTCAPLLTVCTYRIIHTGVGTYNFAFTPDHQDDSITLSSDHRQTVDLESAENKDPLLEERKKNKANLSLILVTYATMLRKGRDSSVGIATRYELDGPWIESRWEARFSATIQTDPRAHPASYANSYRDIPRGNMARAWRKPPTILRQG